MSPLNHAQARQWLEQAADGLLDAAQQAQLDAHLAGCAECQAYAAELAALEGLIGQTLHAHWGEPTLPKQFEQNLAKQQGGPAKPAGPAAGGPLPWLLGGLGLVALLALLWSQLSGGSPSPTATASPAALATASSSATHTATATPTATPAPLVLVAVPSQNANCREGNSNQFDIADTLFAGEEYTPLGRGRDNLWVQFAGPVNGVTCWVYVVNLSLLINDDAVAIEEVPESLLPFVAYPPTPTPSPTFTFTPEPLQTTAAPAAQCNDGIDNDGDGAIDFTPPSTRIKADPQCNGPNDNDERR